MIVTATVLLVLFSGALKRFHLRETERQLQTHALLAAERFGEPMVSGHAKESLERLMQQMDEGNSLRITLIRPDGTVAADSNSPASTMDNHRNRPEVQQALAGSIGHSIRYSDTLRTPMMYIAAPVELNGRRIGVARAAMPLTDLEQVVASVRIRLWAGGLSVLLLAILFSLLVSRHISRPLERIREGAERFACGDFSYRLGVAGSAEAGLLASTMNDMAAQLEERLQTLTNERNEREAVLSSMIEGVLAVDTDGRIISLNQAAARVFHVQNPEEQIGRAIEEVIRHAPLQRFVRDVLVAGQTRECEITVRNSETFFLQACGTRLQGLHNEQIGAVVVLNDITRLRRLENLRRDFVANVSHELKTPITSIKGFVETLLDGALDEPPEARRFLGIVAKHADRLNAIIEDLLVLSRLEQTGSDAMERSPCRIGGLLQSVVDICTQRAEEKKITLHIECPDNLSANVNPPLIEQALVNLVGNAIKYSTDGKTVTLHARQEAGKLILSVEDQGFGIERQHLDRLFERFYRVDKGRSRQEGGTGLGLSIVKHIAQAHGGEVSVQSRFGEGSRFTLTLPLTPLKELVV